MYLDVTSRDQFWPIFKKRYPPSGHVINRQSLTVKVNVRVGGVWCKKRRASVLLPKIALLNSFQTNFETPTTTNFIEKKISLIILLRTNSTAEFMVKQIWTQIHSSAHYKIILKSVQSTTKTKQKLKQKKTITNQWNHEYFHIVTKIHRFWNNQIYSIKDNCIYAPKTVLIDCLMKYVHIVLSIRKTFQYTV